jgi:hypothetical protein
MIPAPQGPAGPDHHDPKSPLLAAAHPSDMPETTTDEHDHRSPEANGNGMHALEIRSDLSETSSIDRQPPFTLREVPSDVLLHKPLPLAGLKGAQLAWCNGSCRPRGGPAAVG